MIEKLKNYIESNLTSDVFVKFNKFSYGQENASCTKFIDEEKDVQRIDRTYLDEEFDKEYSRVSKLSPNIKFQHVKGHADDKWNNYVDKLAVRASQELL